MLTPDDHTRLYSLFTPPPTTPKPVTPDDAAFIRRCIHQNSYLLGTKAIRWWFPVDSAGYPLDGAKCIDSPIVKPRPPKAPRLPSPSSLNTTQPWLDEGIHRTTWFARRASAPKLATLLAGKPTWMSEAEGLKLRSVLVVLAVSHKLDINRLWEAACKGLSEVRLEGD